MVRPDGQSRFVRRSFGSGRRSFSNLRHLRTEAIVGDHRLDRLSVHRCTGASSFVFIAPSETGVQMVCSSVAVGFIGDDRLRILLAPDAPSNPAVVVV